MCNIRTIDRDLRRNSPFDSFDPALQKKLTQFFQLGQEQGCPKDQLLNFAHATIILQPRQLAASAAARLCDQPNGPKAIGYGGARGGGKTHWLLAQMGADDCQRLPGLKCLLLRKVGKSNLENFEDQRQRLFHRLHHEFNVARGWLTFENGSRIVLGHYQCEKEIDSYLGLEYDVIGIEEATQLTLRKYEDISTCCRTSKPNWRPRIYSTTNPGGIGHQWYLEKFINPRQCGTESETRFKARYPQPTFECDCLWRARRSRMLRRFVAGADAFGSESNGDSVAKQYRELGLHLSPASMNRIAGWSAVLLRLGDLAVGIKPTLFIHQRCQHLIECLPLLQQNPDYPGDVLKSNIKEDGVGGDDSGDALRYLLATKPIIIRQIPLRGL